MKISFLKKFAFSLLIFTSFGSLIYLFVLKTGNSFLFSLLILPVFLTSFFYHEGYKIILPAFLGMTTLFIYYADFFGISSSYILPFIVSSSIFSIVNISTSYSGYRILKWEESEKRRIFLSLLLRQDIRSKKEEIQGYIDLLERSPDQNYLNEIKKAVNEIDDILSLSRILNEVEEKQTFFEKNINKLLREVIERYRESSDVNKIKTNFSSKTPYVLGDQNLEDFFSIFLKTRIQKSNSENIKITTKEQNNYVKIKIMDDGDTLRKELKKIFCGESYLGNTTGQGGATYFIIKEIADKYRAEINVKTNKNINKFCFYFEKPN